MRKLCPKDMTGRDAARCYEKAGFQREGIRRQVLFRDGRYHDARRMGILQEEFLKTEQSAK